jgi:hypothetical protein
MDLIRCSSKQVAVSGVSPHEHWELFKTCEIRDNVHGHRSWITVLALFALLAGVGFVAYAGWRRDGDFAMPAAGYLALALGVVFSLMVGIGLMALLFYSSREGYDQPPTLIVPAPDEAEDHRWRDRAMRNANNPRVDR